MSIFAPINSPVKSTVSNPILLQKWVYSLTENNNKIKLLKISKNYYQQIFIRSMYF